MGRSGHTCALSWFLAPELPPWGVTQSALMAVVLSPPGCSSMLSFWGFVNRIGETYISM